MKKKLVPIVFLIFSTISFSQKDESSFQKTIDVKTNNILKITTLYNDGLTILKSDDFENAIDYIDEGLSLSEKIKNDSLIAKGDFYKAVYFQIKQEHAVAIDLFNRALNRFEKLNHSKFIIKSQRRLADINYKLANYEKAIFYNFEALKYNERIDDEIGIAEDLSQIGVIYLSTKDYDNARSNFQKALELYQKHNNIDGKIGSYINLGAVNQKNKNYEKALHHFKKGLPLAEKNNLKIDQSILLGNIGSTNRDLKNYNEALQYLFKALSIKEEIKRYSSAAHTCNDIAQTYISMNDFKKAKKYAIKAIGFAKNRRLNQERFAYSLLSKCNYELGNYKTSYQDLKNYNQLNDSIFAISKAAAINELQIQYDTEKRDLKIKQQESNIAYLDAKNKAANQLLLFGGVATLLAFVIFYLYRNRKRLQREKTLQEEFSQDLIEAQEQERIRVARELHDGVSQQLMMITRKSKDMGDNLLEVLSKNTLNNLRNISHNLHPAVLEQLGFQGALEELVTQLNDQETVQFSFKSNTDMKLNKDQSLHLYRIVQEACQNILKHAQATKAEIGINKVSNQLSLKISDNGKGFTVFNDLKNIKSLGLKSLRERCNIIGAELKIISRPNQGTVIEALIS